MKLTFSLLTLACITSSSLAATDWGRFRGPNGSGLAETTGLPSVVDESTTLWHIPVGKGWSSPVLWGDMVVVTAETAANKRAVLALSAKDGKELWRHEEEFVPHNLHKTYNTFASSSPFVDAERIYINWSSGPNIQALALDHSGKPVWRNDQVTGYIHEHGTGVSALVVDGIMIVRSEFDVEKNGKDLTTAPEQREWKSCVIGLDAKTGKQVWRHDMPNCLNTFSTPVVHALKNGGKEIICANTGSGVMGLDLKTGKVNWQHNPGYSQRSLGSGVLSDEFYFCTFGTGGGVKEIAALDLKSGKPKPVNFDIPKGLPYVPSPLVIGELMYLLGDGGILRCVEFKTGKVVYEERVEGVQGSAKFFSSPVAADGKIFCTSQQGDLIVIKAGPKFERIAASKLDAPVNSVPAIGDQRLFIRTANSLYCIGAKGSRCREFRRMNRQNPFPGMNPFMERTWSDVHLSLMAYICDLMGRDLPDDLLARAELSINRGGSGACHFIPDVAILSEDRWKHGLPPVWSPDPAAQTLVVTEPELLEVEEVRHRWVEIISDQGQLITVIEVLSPVNKTRQREAYAAKRDDYLSAGVNVVEIDLLRQGRLTVNLEGTGHEQRGKGAEYAVCVTRAAFPARREFYPCQLRQKLPVIRIPLRLSDADVPLDIQALVNRCYESGRYWKLDTTCPLVPPLNADDQAWAQQCLTAAGLWPVT